MSDVAIETGSIMEDNKTTMTTTTSETTESTNNDNSDSSYLSFSNPNYQFEDCLNSNNNNNLETSSLNDTSDSTEKKDRKKYANLDLSDLGIPSSPSSLTSPGTPSRNLVLHKLNSPFSEGENSEDESFENCLEEDLSEKDLLSDKTDIRKAVSYRLNEQPSSFLGYYSMLEAKARESAATNIDAPDSNDDDDFELTEEEETTPMMISSISKKFGDSLGINSPDSNDSGIQSDSRSEAGTPHTNGDAEANKKSEEKSAVKQEEEVKETTEEDKTDGEEKLPTGWEKYEDEDGPYYWHIKSGTIQRELPSPSQGDSLRSALTNDVSNHSLSSLPSTPTSISSNTEEHLQEFEGHALQYAAKSLQSLCSQPPCQQVKTDHVTGEKPIRYAVRSLGWVSIAEEDLTPERSSKAVNKCIVDLSLGRNDINDVVGRWGDGKDLFMDLDSKSLRLVDTQDFSVLNSQSIHSIRVWGVGRDNGRDFAYVARDKMSRRHMCHVFRCDNPARQIANTLRDICKKIMLERTLQQTTMKLNRPTDLPNLEKMGQPNGGQKMYQSVNFPTPMEEPKKSIRCHYLGTEIVPRATGMEILNVAVNRVYDRIPPERWHFVNVSIAPSTITIAENGNPENKIDEIRVRFLSFMGIAMSNVKLCAFVVHTAENLFVAHVFHCEPSAGPLCKTIEAACKLRYQKCMDAHPQSPKTPPSQGKTTTQALLPASFKTTVKAGVTAGVQGVKAGVQGVKAGVQGVTNLLSSFKSKRTVIEE
ncbi:protein Fe65 homolog isoform X1 [Patella vulgata]|uniref:protein Fe65 homolog isoform X1 n=1 Tax=Patella vulgata TaxID=6465 RepID=UPI0021803C9E|nr:protein Fe65 homolog isoform X1 [Patella vulgata]